MSDTEDAGFTFDDLVDRPRGVAKFMNGSAPVQCLERLHLVGDAEHAVECWCIAHGEEWSRFGRENKPFKVPQGVTVQYYAPRYFLLSFKPSDLLTGVPQAADLTRANIGTENTKTAFVSGEDCPNCHLSKAQGRHAPRGRVPEVQADASGTSYIGLQKIAHAARILIATVRNRKSVTGSGGMNVEQLVADVQSCCPAIAKFHLLCCRANAESLNDYVFNPFKQQYLSWSTTEKGIKSKPVDEDTLVSWLKAAHGVK